MPQNIYLIITICIILIASLISIIIHKNKSNASKQIQQLSQQIRDLMKPKTHFYHAIYYELKKIDSIITKINNQEKEVIVKHLTNIYSILTKKIYQRKKINDIEEMLLLTYDQIVNLLHIKYGIPEGNYFLDKTCLKENPYIKRSEEGLQIHHVKEYQERGLSKPEIAKKLPFKYQQEDQLVYCNLIEHFLLHIKICDYSKNPHHPEVGLKGAEILGNILRTKYMRNNWEQEAYKRKAYQKVHYLKSSFWKCHNLFKSIKIWNKFFSKSISFDLYQTYAKDN
ncbi:hypothetical protein [Candidatus Phytoplasma meliae]|uniref:Uncharacterized protein n=1 Tax=Candidatus Phytoplasma meliae TaxID=1848402 RepID=A0ABS5CYP0_9MOLU|nr:hypothetical protein [Candidatus Phytoplasma meliae]MBP5836101.1 hypothetical protein [Candidatus Phytoplasma meliae]